MYNIVERQCDSDVHCNRRACKWGWRSRHRARNSFVALVLSHGLIQIEAILLTEEKASKC